jgi:plastocyanin
MRIKTVSRPGALVLSIPLLMLACRGDNREDPAALMEDTVREPVAAEGWSHPGVPAYEAIVVEGGGTVTGTVRLAEPVPALADLPVLRNQAACGEHRPDPSLVLGRENGVANVVVSLVGVSQGKQMEPLAEPATLDQVECEYVPHVQVVPVGTTLQIINSDPILHNVHAHLNGTESIFNLAMPIQGYRIQRSLDIPGIVSVKCDAGHTWMSAYIVVQEHPYYSVTTEDGFYSIEDVPAGKYRLKLWHGWLGETEVAVEMEANATATVDLELNAPKVDPS